MNIDDRIQLIYSWWKTSMLAIANRNISWPRSSDHSKTYMYMWFKKFAEWVEQNNLDDDTASKIVSALVKYAKKKGVLNKGASILGHKRIYEIALREIEDIENKKELELDSWKKIINELDSLRKEIPLYDFLIKKRGIGELPNIVLLFKSGVLTTQFLAISKTCRRAINSLDKEIRELLPSNIDLMRIQLKIKFDDNKKELASSLLQADYAQ